MTLIRPVKRLLGSNFNEDPLPSRKRRWIVLNNGVKGRSCRSSLLNQLGMALLGKVLIPRIRYPDSLIAIKHLKRKRSQSQALQGRQGALGLSPFFN